MAHSGQYAPQLNARRRTCGTFAVAWDGGGLTLAVAALLCLAVPVLLCGLRADGGRERYMSSVMTSLHAAVYRSVFDFALLPYRAWVGVSAAVTALWRMSVTHRGMLEWTTAAQTEGRRDAPRAYYSRMWPCCIAAALLIAAPYHGVFRAIFCILAATAWVAGAVRRLPGEPQTGTRPDGGTAGGGPVMAAGAG